MIELIVVLSSIVALFLVVLVLLIQGLLAAASNHRLSSRLRHARYSLDCPRCRHVTDLRLQASAKAYDEGVCAFCGAPLTDLEDTSWKIT